jgi:hypothetical protein
LKAVAAELGSSHSALVDGIAGKGGSSRDSRESKESDAREEHDVSGCVKARRVASRSAEGTLLEKC